MNELRVVVVGDQQVGKTSLIQGVIFEHFQQKGIPPVVPEVTLPPDVTQNKLPTRIVDTSSKPTDRAKVEQEIRSAGVVVIVFTYESETFERIRSYWLPLIQKLGVEVPILLAANKVDDPRDDEISQRFWNENVSPLMDDFKAIELALDCSAKKMTNVRELFYYAQKAILYPVLPLYDSSAIRLREECIHALKRIFTICDTDKDDALNDKEFLGFQERCSSEAINIQDLKELIRENNPNGINKDNAVTFAGFLLLHHLLIKVGHVERTWTILKTFGYEPDRDKIKFNRNYLEPKYDLGKEETAELSSEAIDFLSTLFKSYDKDRDDCLSKADIDEMFSICHPEGLPFMKNFQASVKLVQNDAHTDNFLIPLPSFLALWALMTNEDPEKAMRYLALLGLPNSKVKNPPDRIDNIALRKIKSKSGSSAKKAKDTHSLRCFVLGAPGVGKTSLLENFVGKNHKTSLVTARAKYVAVNQLALKGSSDPYYLILEELDEKPLATGDDELSHYDLAILVYDISSPETFKFIEEAATKIVPANPRLPCLFIANQVDKKKMTPQTDNSKEEGHLLCKKIGIPPPLYISLKQLETNREESSKLYKDIANAALLSTWVPGRGGLVSFGTFALASVALLGLSVAGYLIWRANWASKRSLTSSRRY